jgi:hypothetical protein
MDEDDFKLFSQDSTIRQLRDQVLERGEDVRWRLSLLDKLERQSTQLQRIGSVTVGEFKKLRKELRHVLEPGKLEVTIDKRIDVKLAARADRGLRTAVLFVLKTWAVPLVLMYLALKFGLKP